METKQPLKPKLSHRLATNEYALWSDQAQMDHDHLGAVNEQYYSVHKNFKFFKYISHLVQEPEEQQAMIKLSKLAPKVDELMDISFFRIKKKDSKLINLLESIRVNKLKGFIFKADRDASVKFSLYARSILRFTSKVSQLVEISYFTIQESKNAFGTSDSIFGKILMSCGKSATLRFHQCSITINGFDYLDNAHPLIRRLDLSECTIVQPEEDNQLLEGLMQKMAKSKLNDSLEEVNISTIVPMSADGTIIRRMNYNIGNFCVNILIYSS
ncbi:unnamed protein product [Moneuplotes crassus]|uniref:Uncharacterized protein n=1 Tax=Euplotes crassus TaxID=5936 RepID=A0AAD1XSG8_EUPCR|nr:unnamed protein product [Moneuplotes crassus]